MLIPVTIAAALLGGSPAFDEAAVIAYGKRADVAKLDPVLPKQGLERWIVATLKPPGKVVWRTSDCGLKPDVPEPREGNPLCVDFVVVLDDVGVWGRIIVGTDRQGVVGEPRMHGVTLIKGRSRAFKGADELSEIPHLLSDKGGWVESRR
jgi:hypothetical protein